MKHIFILVAGVNILSAMLNVWCFALDPSHAANIAVAAGNAIVAICITIAGSAHV